MTGAGFRGTPGPWTLEPEFGANGKLDGWYRLASGDDLVAINIRPEDAALIAQAPAMLEALFAIREAYGNCGTPHQQAAADKFDAILAALRAGGAL